MSEEYLRNEVNRLNNVIAERDMRIHELQMDIRLLKGQLAMKAELISSMVEKLGLDKKVKDDLPL